MTALVKRTEAFSETAIDGEVVVLDLKLGTFFSLTGTAAEIWALIDGTRSRDAVLGELTASYDLNATVIADDLDAFLTQLFEAGFLARS